MNMKNGALIAAAAAALLVGCGPATQEKSVASGMQEVKCSGVNECKGTSECASKDGNSCQGLNECKGHGWVTESSADACTTKGGTVITS